MLRAIADEYRTNLFESVIPFWMRHSVDREFGGYFTCLDREGAVYDTRKYVWLQGRQVWTLSKLYNEVEPRRPWIEAARLGVEFLRRHARDPQGRCYFSLTREGQPSFYQRKPYAGVFLMLGLLEYSKASGDLDCRREAEELFWLVRDWVADARLLGRPALEGAPALRQLADLYVTCSMALELATATSDPRYRDILAECLRDARLHFHPGSGLLLENAAADGTPRLEVPEGRLICPGSICEVAWFLLRALAFHPNERQQQWVLSTLEAAIEFGWDRQHGGLFYFQDLEGKPTLQLEASMKLWWVHIEAIVALAHAWAIDPRPKWRNWLERVHEYTWAHFPDPAHGEWFGYLDRQGNVSHTLKGNNYKGCFHVPRGLLYASRLLEEED
jgi:N-acylglucosamine 2-epimerase